MPKQPGILLFFNEGKSADKILASIEAHNRFTTVVSASEVQPQIGQPCLIGLSPDTVDFVGVAQRGQLVATDQKRISISRLTALDGLPLSELFALVPRRLKRYLVDYGDGAYRLPPGLLDSLLQSIRQLRPNLVESVIEIEALVAELVTLSKKKELGLEVLERDAIATALQVWGGPEVRKSVLREARPSTDKRAPFLNQLSGITIREDIHIINDASQFPGFETARQYQVGAIELVSNRGKKLTILNCNRQPLEETLGVDLVYYNHAFDSFVLVQYKRLVSKSGGEPVYRPTDDKNYAVELERMTNFSSQLGEQDEEEGLLSYRLGNAALFFKFCQAKAKSAIDQGMVPGMYFPLELWQQFVLSPKARGPKQGLRLTWTESGRHLNNSEFTSLLKNGWIGSASGQSKRISSIIHDVLHGNRMLVVAASGDNRNANDFHRDDVGRFASRSDPLSSQ